MSNRAVSPVIGTVLLTAIVVLLAGTIGAFVFGLGDSIGSEPPPQAATDSYITGDTLRIEIHSTSNTNSLDVVVDGETETTLDEPGAGDTVVITGVPENATVSLVDSTGDSATTVASTTSTQELGDPSSTTVELAASDNDGAGGGGGDGKAAGPAASGTTATVWARTGGDLANSNSITPSSIPSESYNTDEWVYRTSQYESLGEHAVGDSHVFVPVAPASGGPHELLAINKNTGDVDWTWSSTEDKPYITNPITDGDTVYIGNDGKVHALDSDTGSTQWTHTTGTDDSTDLALAPGTVYVNDDRLLALDRETGDKKWRVSESSNIIRTMYATDTMVFVGAGSGVNYAVYHNGTVAWKKNVAGNAASGIVYNEAAGTVITARGHYDSEGYVVAHDATNGSIKWKTTVGTETDDIALVDGSLYISRYTSSEITIMDPSDGSEEHQIQTNGFSADVFTVTDDRVLASCSDYDAYYEGYGGLCAFDADTGNIEWGVGEVGADSVSVAASSFAVGENTVYTSAGGTYDDFRVVKATYDPDFVNTGTAISGLTVREDFETGSLDSDWDGTTADLSVESPSPLEGTYAGTFTESGESAGATYNTPSDIETVSVHFTYTPSGDSDASGVIEMQDTDGGDSTTAEISQAAGENATIQLNAAASSETATITEGKTYELVIDTMEGYYSTEIDVTLYTATGVEVASVSGYESTFMESYNGMSELHIDGDGSNFEVAVDVIRTD